MKNKAKQSKKTRKSSKVKVSVVNAAAVRGVIPINPKKSSKVRVALINAAAVGGVIPINLKVGRNFGKSDKVMITMECCGPYHQHCDSFVRPA